MSIVLPPDLEELINRRMEEGGFKSPLEVVREALEQMDGDGGPGMDRDPLRREAAAGVAQADRGELIPDSAEEQTDPEVTWATAEQLRRDYAAAVEKMERGEYITYPDGAAAVEDARAHGRALLAERAKAKR